MNARCESIAFVLILLILAVPAAAQETQLASLYDKYQLTTSLTSVILNADIRVDSKDGSIGTTIDAEDDLGLAQVKVQPRFAGRMRLGRRHEIEAGYQFARRTSDKTLERTLEFGDTTFDAGLNIKGELNTDLLFINYRYAFMAKERTQVGVGVGLGALFLKTGIDALASAGSNQVTYSSGGSVTGPLGSIGLYGRFLISNRWQAEADARFVKIKIDRFHARYLEGSGAGRYFFSRKWGAELGYGFDAVKVDIDPRTRKTGESGIFSGQIKFSLQNVRLGVVFIP